MALQPSAARVGLFRHAYGPPLGDRRVGDDDLVVSLRWRRRLIRGLNASVSDNAQAFGFSITITVSFGVVSVIHPGPSLPDLVGFALAAVAAFSLLNLVVARLVRSDVDVNASTRAMLIGTATDFVAVAAAVGAAIGISEGVHGWIVWELAPFGAALLYVFVQAIELAVGQRLMEQDD